VEVKEELKGEVCWKVRVFVGGGLGMYDAIGEVAVVG
jgi:hypothetical protein